MCSYNRCEILGLLGRANWRQYLFQTRQCVCQDQKQEPPANLNVQLKLTQTSPCSCPSVLPGTAAWLREMVGEYEDADSLEIGSGAHLVQGMLCPTVPDVDKAHH